MVKQEYEFSSKDAIEMMEEIKGLINDMIKELKRIEPDW
jgi:hypothetical protein